MATLVAGVQVRPLTKCPRCVTPGCISRITSGRRLRSWAAEPDALPGPVGNGVRWMKVGHSGAQAARLHRSHHHCRHRPSGPAARRRAHPPASLW